MVSLYILPLLVHAVFSSSISLEEDSWKVALQEKVLQAKEQALERQLLDTLVQEDRLLDHEGDLDEEAKAISTKTAGE